MHALIVYPDFQQEWTDDIDQKRGQKLKFDNIKPFIKISLSSAARKLFNLIRVLSCLEADLHMLLMCKLKFTGSSMWIPSSLTDEVIHT